MRKILKSLASIKLGVVIILALGTLTAWGTFVEARYNDSAAAQKLVYNSYWMYTTMAALAICLIAVMIDRWPWRKKHTGFVLAHIGIIIIMIGSLMTRYLGLDGSMSLAIGESSRFVATSDVALAVYASMGGDSRFTKVGESDVDFFLHPPSRERPLEIPLAGGSVKIVEYYPYAFREEKVIESERPGSGAAVRFQLQNLQNPRVSLTEWLVQTGSGRAATKNLGPAQVIFASDKVDVPLDRNAIVLRPKPTAKLPDQLEYEIHTARAPGKVKTGKIRPGEMLETGWMGLVLRVLKFMPRAEELVTYKPAEQASPVTTAAIKVNYQGADHWLGLNSMIKLFTDQAVYIVSYANQRRELDFDLSLKEFKVGRYPGTMRAASYESLVDVPEKGLTTISMNEPLKHHGFTFYQASFSEDEQGRPVASVLSVNRDPGRWIKYLGSFLIVAGTIHLFYFKRSQARKKAKSDAEPEKESA